MDAGCPPSCVGSRGLRALGGTAAVRHRLVGELGDRAPIVGCGRLRRGGPGALRPCRPGRGRLAEQVRARHGLDTRAGDGTPRRHGRGDDLEKVAGVAHGVAGIDLHGLLAAPVEDGEAGVEAGAAPRIGAAVDGCGKRDVRGRVEGGEGVRPRGVPGDTVRRRDRYEPAAGREHRKGRADVVQIYVMADALGPRGWPKRAGSSGPRWGAARGVGP